MEDITSRVKEIIVDRLCIDGGDVIPEANFADNFGADPLDIVELIVEFETEFNITIPDNQAERINTVGEAIAYIERNTLVYTY